MIGPEEFESILYWVTTFIAPRVVFLALFVPVVLSLHYVLRVGWNRAAIVAAALCIIAIAALEFVPMQTHMVKLDMPRSN